jgi:hypothetical protein
VVVGICDTGTVYIRFVALPFSSPASAVEASVTVLRLQFGKQTVVVVKVAVGPPEAAMNCVACAMLVTKVVFSL